MTYAGLVTIPKGQRVEWGRYERGAYIKEWYERGYPTPTGGWEEYDIHHIIPREYGGTNDFWNLVPVLRPDHQTQFNPWWRGDYVVTSNDVVMILLVYALNQQQSVFRHN